LAEVGIIVSNYTQGFSIFALLTMTIDRYLVKVLASPASEEDAIISQSLCDKTTAFGPDSCNAVALNCCTNVPILQIFQGCLLRSSVSIGNNFRASLGCHELQNVQNRCQGETQQPSTKNAVGTFEKE
jgi:hypothetical protein